MTGNAKERQGKARKGKSRAMSLVAGEGGRCPRSRLGDGRNDRPGRPGPLGSRPSRVWSQTGYRMAQTAGAGLGAVALRPPKTSASAGTRRRCATPNTDMISITAAATKATTAPISMICPISQNA